MPETTEIKAARPYWLPDTQGFLAVAIILIVALLAFILLASTVKFDDKIAGAFMTLLGVLTACLKDVYSYFFGSSRGEEKKGDVISSIASAPTPPPTPAPGTITTTATAPASVTTTTVAPWWPLLTPAEQAAITAAASTDAKVMAFVTAANVGKASQADLDYLVTAHGLLTQARADEIGKV